MNIKAGYKAKNLWFGIGAVIGVYLICMRSLFNISGISIAKFLLLNLVSIFLPGLSILSVIGIRQSRVGAFCTSYLLGYSFLVVEYFFSEMFDRRLSFMTITILVAFVSFFFLGKKMKAREPIVKLKEADNEKPEFC